MGGLFAAEPAFDFFYGTTLFIRLFIFANQIAIGLGTRSNTIFMIPVSGRILQIDSSATMTRLCCTPEMSSEMPAI